MYAITYDLQTGSVLHRAPSAAAALETMRLLKMGGAVVVKVTATRNGKEVSVAELHQLARDER
jgi:ribosomal protein L30/L7E